MMENEPDSCLNVKKKIRANSKLVPRMSPTLRIKYCPRTDIVINGIMYADTKKIAAIASEIAIPMQIITIPGIYGVPSFLKTRFFIRMVGSLNDRTMKPIIDPSNSNANSVDINKIISSKLSPLRQPLIRFSKNIYAVYTSTSAENTQ